MFRIIVVDDEKMALERFEQLAQSDARLSPVGKFLTGREALSYTAENPVDIAFLDIEMPDGNGLDLAEALFEQNPHIETVFVTAHEEYALQAFRTHAIGYLLKPLGQEELREQIDKIEKKIAYRSLTWHPSCLTIQCFGPFQCRAGKRASDAIHFRTAKAEELLAFLLHHRGNPVAKAVLVETLWPEAPPSKGANHFRVTCTYLRNTFAEAGFSDMLLREKDSYRLNTEKLDCDLFPFASALTLVSALTIPELERTARYYAGPYFSDRAYDWAASTRTWYENEYKKILYRLADLCAAQHQSLRETEVLERLLLQDPDDEKAVIRLITLKTLACDKPAAVKIARDYRRRLSDELGLSPTQEFEEIVAGLQ